MLATVSRLLHHSARVSGRRRAVSGRRPQPRNSAMLGHLFECNDNTDTFLCGSFLFERAKGLVTHFHDPPQEEHQMSAKLHCLYGVPVLKCGRTRSSAMYPFACSKVYDLRQYSDNSRWGPFMNDGSDRVDWEKVEAILIIIYHNIRAGGLDKFPVFYAFWRVAFAGSWPGSYEPMHLPLYHLRRHDDEDSCADHFDDDGYPAPAPAAASSSTDAGVSSSHPRPVQLPIRSPSSLGLEDPYGVSGTWIRMVCFLDYNDFFAFNFPITDALPDNVPRPSLDIGEATRLILMKIHVSRIEPPGPEDGQALPVVHFKGTSRSLDGESANSDLRGDYICPHPCAPPPQTAQPLTFASSSPEQGRVASRARARSAGPPSPSSTARSAGAARASRSAACAPAAASSATGSTPTTTPKARAGPPPSGRSATASTTASPSSCWPTTSCLSCPSCRRSSGTSSTRPARPTSTTTPSSASKTTPSWSPTIPSPTASSPPTRMRMRMSPSPGPGPLTTSDDANIL